MEALLPQLLVNTRSPICQAYAKLKPSGFVSGHQPSLASQLPHGAEVGCLARLASAYVSTGMVSTTTEAVREAEGIPEEGNAIGD